VRHLLSRVVLPKIQRVEAHTSARDRMAVPNDGRQKPPGSSSHLRRSRRPAVLETYEDGLRKVIYRDPDGNEIGFGGSPLE
jgi:hypothetical protein